MLNNQKIFIIGLPRTGTTSVCKALLNHPVALKVAHTAYSENCFNQAQVFADTPIFNDFEALDKFYPNSKFIYLSRSLETWLPSISQLLVRMHTNLVRTDGGFNPTIKRCYQHTFGPLTLENIYDNAFLTNCYNHHKSKIERYFSNRQNDLLTLDVSKDNSYQNMLSFLALPQDKGYFERVNIGGKVTAWKDIKSDNKIPSTNNGRASTLPYMCKE